MKIFSVLALALLLPLSALAQHSPNTVALQGYDVVSYFQDGGPVRGIRNHATRHKEQTYLFRTAQNLRAFEADPARYLPAYDGYCAYAASNGQKAPGDPEAWTVIDGRLFLNFNKDVRRTWLKDARANIRKADKNWPKIRNR